MPGPLEATVEKPGHLDPLAKLQWWPWAPSWRRDPPHPELQRSPNTAFYPGLDLLRGFAAISVVIYHVIEWFKWESFPSHHPLALWFRLGWMGVDLFFVISGFVIATSALNLLERDESRYAREFCRRRLSRIAPLHYLTCVIFALFVTPSVLFLDDTYIHVLTHFSFTHNLLWYTQGSINGPNWSLGVEMQFYVLILLTAPLLRRMNPMALLAICVGVAWTWRAWIFRMYGGEQPSGINMTWFGVSQVPGARRVWTGNRAGSDSQPRQGGASSSGPGGNSMALAGGRRAPWSPHHAYLLGESPLLGELEAGCFLEDPPGSDLLARRDFGLRDQRFLVPQIDIPTQIPGDDQLRDLPLAHLGGANPQASADGRSGPGVSLVCGIDALSCCAFLALLRETDPARYSRRRDETEKSGGRAGVQVPSHFQGVPVDRIQVVKEGA